jgi:hypothetical protein
MVTSPLQSPARHYPVSSDLAGSERIDASHCSAAEASHHDQAIQELRGVSLQVLAQLLTPPIA